MFRGIALPIVALVRTATHIPFGRPRYAREVVPRTSFAAESLLERKDLQRLLRRDVAPLGDDLVVIAEEYGE